MTSFLISARDRCYAELGAGISWRVQLLVFLVAAAAVVSRRPDALFNPQFFGEDGTIWYREAYMSGWFSSLFHSQNGYFQTIPRLAASLALLAPLRFAPLVMNLIGITFQVLPANLVLSSRCRNWGPLYLRALMAFTYIALPNTMELDATVEEAQWHLALLACILVLAYPPSALKWRVFDVTIVLLSGLSGPFALVLLPIAFVFWYFRRDRWRLALIATLALTACVQVSALLRYASATRPHVILGATPKLFIRLLAGQVYLGALLGQTSLPAQQNAILLGLVAVLGTTILVYCLLKAGLEWKLFIAFCLLVFAASLRSPMVSMTTPQWEVLRDSLGIRYWFLPMLAFVWALLWCATGRNNTLVWILAITGLMFMCIGVIHDWSYPAYPDLRFPGYAKQFAAAAPGTLFKIPICPSGWFLQLTKRGGACRTLPAGVIDQPATGARVSGTISVSGWVTSSESIRRVDIYIDKLLAQSVLPDLSRPDVDALYPHSPNKYTGWRAVMDMSQVAPGTHEIEVRALEADGCESDVDVVRVER